MGRPKRGALSSYPLTLCKKIKSLRQNNEGWGAISILVELENRGHYPLKDLPSPDAVHRYLCLLYTSPSPRDQRGSRMPSSA